MRPEVKRLADLGPMPDERSNPSVEVIEELQHALDALPSPLTDEEAIALLDSFPDGEHGSLYEVEWSLLHAIESAPYGPSLLEALDDRSWWVSNLRRRAERGGLL